MNWNFISLAKLITKTKTVIKLKDYDFCEPAFLLWILSLYKSWIIDIDCNGLESEIYNYLNRIDFFNQVWFKCKKVKRNHSDNLVEITSISEKVSGVDTDKISKKIIKNIWIPYETKNKFLYWALEWIFRELVDNTIQHSKANFIEGGSYFMLQSYPKRWDLHICIVDNWIWIKESFRDSIYWNEFKMDKFYIDFAFQRWITSNSEIWAWNWLYWTKEIIKKTNSKLNYLSWKTLFTIDWEEKYFTQNDTWWNWVLLDLQINLDNLSKSDIIEWLKEIGHNSSFIDQELDDKEYDELFW